MFVDTDGDLSFSDYTRIALLGSAGLIIVPSEASLTDYNRLLTFCEVRRVPPDSCRIHSCVVFYRHESRSENRTFVHHHSKTVNVMQELKLLHTQAGSGARLLAVTWNKVNVQKHAPCLPVSSTLTPYQSSPRACWDPQSTFGSESHLEACRFVCVPGT